MIINEIIDAGHAWIIRTINPKINITAAQIKLIKLINDKLFLNGDKNVNKLKYKNT